MAYKNTSVAAMKRKFLEGMRLMYPEGNVSRIQHRDLIRVYAMGWCDCLAADENWAAVGEWTSEFAPLVDFNWWPDASWNWWR